MPLHRRLVLNSCHGALWGGLGLQGLWRSPGRTGKKRRREGFRGEAEAEGVGGGATETRYGKVTKKKKSRAVTGEPAVLHMTLSQKEVCETSVGLSLQQSRSENLDLLGVAELNAPLPPSQMHSHVQSVNTTSTPGVFFEFFL